MISDDVSGKVKPEKGKGGEDSAFLGDAVGQDNIKSRNSVGGDNNKRIPELINVSHLTSFEKFEAFQVSIK